MTAEIDGFRLWLRIHADVEDLRRDLVREVLRLEDDGTELKTTFSDEDHLVYQFQSDAILAEVEEIERWQRPEFKAAVNWMKGQSLSAFRSLRDAGLGTGICLVAYFGLLPKEFLDQVRRLGLDLWVYNASQDRP